MPLSPPSEAPRSSRLSGLVLLGIMLVVALLPWWRNRGYVRDFFDYGVIMGGTGRMEAGQRPYVDFITPIQTGWYALNWAAEKIAGGTFQAMTWSGAASIVVAAGVLGAMLARRWPWWAAAIIAGAITCGSVSQHTLLWYNPWGVVLLTVVAWSGAIAPVLRREHAGWHVLTAVALFLGGANKINIQLMALGLAAGWAVRALLTGRAGGLRTAATLVFHFACGVVLPVLAEMAWTGATFAQWWHNVIAQMAADRAGMLLVALKWDFYVKPCHDYYGQLRLPQVGLAGVILTLVTVAAIFRHQRGRAAWMEKTLAGFCGAIALLGGVILLTTNMDIAYIALAGWLALLVALWLGFGVPARGPWFWGGLIIPALLIGAVSWESAWRGQRSQFGYSNAPRTAYVSGDRAGPAFGYLRGTKVPPEMFAALQAFGAWKESLPPERRHAVLFGPGTEWAAHIWPAPHTPDLPLYILGGWQFGPQEYAATYAAVSGSAFKEITVSLVLDNWRPELAEILRMKYNRRSLGEVFFRYSRAADDAFSDYPVDFLHNFGGTTSPRFIVTPGRFFPAESVRMFIGTSAGRETMKLNAATNRLRGQVIVRRLDPAFTGALAANFSIWAEYDENHRFPRWEQRVALPAGQNEILVDYAIDSSHMPTRFYVDIPPEFAGRVAAGWRGPSILHSGNEGPVQPAWVQGGTGPITVLTEEEIARLLPPDRDWTPTLAIVRDGRMTPDGLELDAGGELWIQASGFVTDFSGVAVFPAGRPVNVGVQVRSLWVKDARVEMYSGRVLTSTERSVDFRSWCAEPNGWLVITIDPAKGAPAVRLQVNRLTHQN